MNKDQIKLLSKKEAQSKTNEEENNHIKSEKKLRKEKKINFLEIENSKLIITYGPAVYEYSRYLEGLTYNLKDSEVKLIEILKDHEITPHIRTKLVDWLFEVLYAYKCDESTIYLTIHLLDAYIFKSRLKLTNSELHLIGVTALYIASKLEDLCPLDLNTVKMKICHNKFSEKELKRKEKHMLETLDFKIIFASTLDFIKNFIYDYEFNNKKVFAKIHVKEEIKYLEESAIFISKIILHNDIFTGFKSSIKAIACIILAFDLVRANVPSFAGEIEKFTNEWLKFLVEQSRYEPDHILQLYNKIKEYYEGFDSIPLIQHNLKKNVSMPF